MPAFSQRSIQRLETCDARLRRLFRAVVVEHDCTILEGHRSVARQQELHRQGKSKIDGVRRKGQHNYKPSRAVDVAPYPIDWNTSKPATRKRWLDFARAVFAEADRQGLKVRWGVDWNQNWDRVSDPMSDPDQRFNDWPHWEIA